MGALILLSLLPMALAFSLFDGNDDDPEETPDATETAETGTDLLEDTPGEAITATAGEVTEGTAGDDTITGTDGADTVLGGDGDDDIYLGDGDDMGDGPDEEQLYAALDDLALESSVGVEQLTEVLEGWDLFGAQGGDGDDYIDGGHGDDAITGNAGDDTLRGNLGADFLFDSRGADSLSGGYGDDVLFAIDGADPAADVLDGGANSDLLWGDDGDTMTGGTGADDFGIYWSAGDAPVAITDYSAADSESLTVMVDSWSNSQSFTLDQTDDGVNVSIDGTIVATLQGARADLIVGSVSVYDSASGNYIDATMA